MALTLLLPLGGCGNTDPPAQTEGYELIVESPEAAVSAPVSAPAPTSSVPEALLEPTAIPAPTPEPGEEPAPATADAVKTVTFLAVGDNLLHNTVLDAGLQPDGSYNYDSLYDPLRELIASYDLAAVNQETPLVYDPALYGSYPEFGSPTAIGDALAGAGFDIVTMATNHICDRGDTGIENSLDFWKTMHPEVSLLGIHEKENEPVTVVEKNGVKIALLDYTYGFNGGGPSEGWMVDTLGSESQVEADLQAAEENADCTVVFLHAGTEYSNLPDAYQEKWFRFIADNGADVIIGTHPHVLQPMEKITADDGREVPVFWSLGNFMSHQLGAERWLGGMAAFTITLKDGQATIENAALTPTFTYIWYQGTKLNFQAYLLKDVTAEMVKNSYYNKYYGTLDKLWALYDEETGN